MNSVFFNANNNRGDVFTFVTNSSSATTFDPYVNTYSSKDGRWDFGDGVAQANNSPFYTYSDSGTNKNVIFSIDKIENISQINMANDGLVGSLDFSKFTNCVGGFIFNTNSQLTAVTFPSTTTSMGSLTAYFCDLREVDLSVMPNFGGYLDLLGNSNLTALTISPTSSQNFSQFRVSSCDIYGRLDFSGYTGTFGGTFIFSSNSNLTGITLPPNTTTISQLWLDYTGLFEPLDFSGFSGLGGNIKFDGTDIPSINFPSNSNSISTLSMNNMPYMTTIDISGLSGLGGSVTMQNNTGLTSVMFPPSSNSITSLALYNCTAIPEIDFSPLSGINGSMSFPGCSNLSALTFPSVSTSVSGILAYSCNFSNYVDMTPLSSSTNNDIGIQFQSNAIPTAGVNQMLYDVDNFGWTGGTFSIQSGTNGAPDGSTGGYDGTGATANLLTKGWTVTTN